MFHSAENIKLGKIKGKKCRRGGEYLTYIVSIAAVTVFMAIKYAIEDSITYGLLYLGIGALLTGIVFLIIYLTGGRITIVLAEDRVYLGNALATSYPCEDRRYTEVDFGKGCIYYSDIDDVSYLVDNYRNPGMPVRIETGNTVVTVAGSKSAVKSLKKLTENPPFANHDEEYTPPKEHDKVWNKMLDDFYACRFDSVWSEGIVFEGCAINCGEEFMFTLTKDGVHYMASVINEDTVIIENNEPDGEDYFVEKPYGDFSSAEEIYDYISRSIK